MGNRLLHDALQAIGRQQMEKVVLARSTLLTLDCRLSAPAMMDASRRVSPSATAFYAAL
ncbi:hypothetical protein AB6846_01630 [Serratia proteamaculans]